MHIGDFPKEIKQHIISFLPDPGRRALAFTNHDWCDQVTHADRAEVRKANTIGRESYLESVKFLFDPTVQETLTPAMFPLQPQVRYYTSRHVDTTHFLEDEV